MNLGTLLYTLLKGKPIGKDQFGNRYFEERRKPRGRAAKRWVLYKGMAEASKVPPLWHAWLHYTVDCPPANDEKTFAWQKEHLPNLSGTAYAYRPAGHALAAGKRDAARGDYQAWRPE